MPRLFIVASVVVHTLLAVGMFAVPALSVGPAPAPALLLTPDGPRPVRLAIVPSLTSPRDGRPPASQRDVTPRGRRDADPCACVIDDGEQ